MKNWKTSLYAQIAYMFGMGAGLLLMPQTLADLFHLGTAQEVWVRVVGMLALLLCVYYYTAIRNNAVWFAYASVYGRYIFCLVLANLGLGYGMNMLIVLAGVETLLAGWTHWSLRGLVDENA